MRLVLAASVYRMARRKVE